MRRASDDGRLDIAEKIYNALAPVVWAGAIVLIAVQLLHGLAAQPLYDPPTPAASVLVRQQFAALKNGEDTSFPPYVPAGVGPAGIPFSVEGR
jgi:hypothetical protein